jgi:hypothetical protein
MKDLVINYPLQRVGTTPLCTAFEGLAKAFSPPPNKDEFESYWRIVDNLYRAGEQLTPTKERPMKFHPLAFLFRHLPQRPVCCKEHRRLHNFMVDQLKRIINAYVNKECEALGISQLDYFAEVRQKTHELCKTEDPGSMFLIKLRTYYYPSLTSFFNKQEQPAPAPQDVYLPPSHHRPGGGRY